MELRLNWRRRGNKTGRWGKLIRDDLDHLRCLEGLSAPSPRYNHLMVLPLTLETRAERRKLAMPAIRTIYCYPKRPPKHRRFYCSWRFPATPTSNQQRVTRSDLITHSRPPLSRSDYSQGREGLMKPQGQVVCF